MAKMRNRMRNKRRQGSHFGAKIGATVAVLAGLAALVTFMFFLSNEPEIDAATGCRKNGSLDTTLIFVDDTTPLSETQAIRIQSIIAEYGNIEPAKHQLILTSVQMALENDFKNIGCIARDPNEPDFNRLTENRALLEKQRMQFFDDLTEWSEAAISVGSYSEYLKRWGAQFDEAGVSVTTTDTEVRLVLSDLVTFASGSASLSSEGERIVANLGRQLAESGEFSVRIVGHTDNLGDEDQNQSLSERRASSAAAIITRSGIDTSDVVTIGRGSLDPLATNLSEEGRRLNRRVEITLAPKRPLLEALDRAFALLGKSAGGDGKKTVVMISDLAQSSPLYSVYSNQPWTEFIQSPEGATLNLSPENISINVYRILRSDTISSKATILDFWRNYFNEKSIQVKRDQEI